MTFIQKWLNRSRCHYGLSTWVGLKEAQVQSYSPGGTNVLSWEGTLAQPGEYDFTVHLRWQCGLMSSFFDHLSLFGDN